MLLHWSNKSVPLNYKSSTQDYETDAFHKAVFNGECTKICYATISEPSGQTYSNQTGKFIMASSSVNNFVCVVYDYDSNAILSEPMKD